MKTHDSEDGENEFIEDDDYGDVVPNPEQSVGSFRLSIKF